MSFAVKVHSIKLMRDEVTLPHLAIIFTDGENNFAALNVPLDEFRKDWTYEQLLADMHRYAQYHLQQQRNIHA